MRRRCPYCSKRMEYMGEIIIHKENFVTEVYVCPDKLNCGCRVEISKSTNKDLIKIGKPYY